MRNIYKGITLVCLSLLFTSGLFAQTLRTTTAAEKAPSGLVAEKGFNLFVSDDSGPSVVVLDKAGAGYETYTLDAASLAELQSSAPTSLEFTLPGTLGKVSLVRSDIFAEGFGVWESGANGYVDAPLGLHYRGNVTGDESSLVAISILEDEVAGLVATDQGNYVIGKMTGTDDRHVVYNDRDLPVPAEVGECQTPDSNVPYSAKALAPLAAGQKNANNCVNHYLEIDHSVYQTRGGGTAAFVTAIFNQVAILYDREQVKFALSDLFVWTTQDPYNSGDSFVNLDNFRNQKNSSGFNGDLAHLISFQASGGVAWVDALCGNLNYAFSAIQNSFNNVPTYSWSVMVVAHEMGHNLGSNHTHACVWNGNGTAIDGCYATEGGCGSSVGIPSGGGTIMSYCHLTGAGINLNKGFGPQPGNVIRNRVYNNSCLNSCGNGGGGGGGGGSNCDFYDFEANQPVPFGGSQDNGTVYVQEEGRILLVNNAWKSAPMTYTLTANTVLEFYFASVGPNIGEIHGIGVDNDNSPTPEFTFQLEGTQTWWGNQDYRNYDVRGQWKYYQIPIGNYLRGGIDRLVFVNDDDVGANNNSFFKHVRLSEANTCPSIGQSINGGDISSLDGQRVLSTEESLSVFPNPASDLLNVDVVTAQPGAASLRVFDITGRSIRDLSVELFGGEQRLNVPVTGLPNGTYVLRIDGANGYSETAKFMVAR